MKGGCFKPPSFAFRQTLKEKNPGFGQPGLLHYDSYSSHVFKTRPEVDAWFFWKILVDDLPGFVFYDNRYNRK
jgi:hypothetical protein